MTTLVGTSQAIIVKPGASGNCGPGFTTQPSGMVNNFDYVVGSHSGWTTNSVLAESPAQPSGLVLLAANNGGSCTASVDGSKLILTEPSVSLGWFAYATDASWPWNSGRPYIVTQRVMVDNFGDQGAVNGPLFEVSANNSSFSSFAAFSVNFNTHTGINTMSVSGDVNSVGSGQLGIGAANVWYLMKMYVIPGTAVKGVFYQDGTTQPDWQVSVSSNSFGGDTFTFGANPRPGVTMYIDYVRVDYAPSLPGAPSGPTTPPGSYTLDLEFDGSTLDSRLVPLWNPTDPGDRLDTDQQYSVTIAQTTQASSILTLACERKTTPSGRAFAGAAWSTYGTFSQKYGTFETRMRYDEAQGTWPSWFFLPVGQKGPFPEIDAMESYGSPVCLGPGFTENVVHYAGETTPDYTVVPLSDSSGWHVHKFVWTSTRVDFYIDGVNTFSVTNPAHVPQVALYPIYTWGVGANNASCRADGTTPNYLSMQIDYLRISV